MSTAAPTRMTREEYRLWLEAQPSGRFERIDGLVVAMARRRAVHLRLKRDVLIALARATAAANFPCEALPSGATVEVEDGDFQPDAVVTCGEPMGQDATVVPNPIIVVEVPAPSTRDDSLTRKFVSYFTLPAVRHCLILCADQPMVIHHRRRDDGDGLDTRFVKSGAIRLDPPGLTITMEEIFGG